VTTAPISTIDKSSLLDQAFPGLAPDELQEVAKLTSINAYPLLTCDPTQNIQSGYMFNTGCFAAPSVGQNGNYVFPYIKGNTYKNLDMSLFKNVAPREGMRLQVGAEFFNLANHPQFEGLGGGIGSATFGQVTNARDPRVIQLRAKFSF